MRRRDFLTKLLAGTAVSRLRAAETGHKNRPARLPRARGGGNAAQGQGAAGGPGPFRRHPAHRRGHGRQARQGGLHRLPGPRDQRRHGRRPRPRDARHRRRARAGQRARQRRGGPRPGPQAGLQPELRQPPHGRRLAERAAVPPDLPDPAAQGRHGRLLGPLGARRGESRSPR